MRGILCQPRRGLEIFLSKLEREEQTACALGIDIAAGERLEDGVERIVEPGGGDKRGHLEDFFAGAETPGDIDAVACVEVAKRRPAQSGRTAPESVGLDESTLLEH
ncbi:MAG TPA: hypothetical protein VGG45_03920 [Terracidiphilus sp.]